MFVTGAVICFSLVEQLNVLSLVEQLNVFHWLSS